MAKKLDYGYCKAAPMLEWIGNKWALVVLVKISESESVRFNQLYRDIPSVSEKVLSQVLRQLVTDGIVSRKLYPDVPPRVEYLAGHCSRMYARFSSGDEKILIR